MPNKIHRDKSDFISVLNQLKREKRIIVFTNGCFDLLHLGHLDYLKRARSFGDLLVVGLNSDESVSKLKSGRPIFDFSYRSEYLSYLDFVDHIVGFTEPTPAEMIDMIIPDILVKGGDYEQKEVVGYDTVMKNGGKVITIPFEHKISTTQIIEKIKRL